MSAQPARERSQLKRRKASACDRRHRLRTAADAHLVCRGSARRRCRSIGAAGARGAGKRYRRRPHARCPRGEHFASAASGTSGGEAPSARSSHRPPSSCGPGGRQREASEAAWRPHLPPVATSRLRLRRTYCCRTLLCAPAPCCWPRRNARTPWCSRRARSETNLLAAAACLDWRRAEAVQRWGLPHHARRQYNCPSASPPLPVACRGKAPCCSRRALREATYGGAAPCVYWRRAASARLRRARCSTRAPEGAAGCTYRELRLLSERGTACRQAPCSTPHKAVPTATLYAGGNVARAATRAAGAAAAQRAATSYPWTSA